LSEHKPKNKKKRNGIILLLIIFFILCGVAYAFYYYSYGRYYESTDDAYVSQNIVYVTPQSSGVVTQVLVHKTQFVKQGELLGKLDSRDANILFNKAKANLAQTVRLVKKLHIQKQEAQLAIALAKIKLQKAKSDFLRNQTVKNQHALAINKFENFKYAYEEAKQNLKIMQQKLVSIKALVKDDNISKNPQVKNAILQLKQSFLNLQRCNIYAPISGIIAKKNFSVGENVSLQSALLAIVPTRGFWVDANFKETQISKMKIGQNVKLYSDLYGKDVLFHGKIAGIAPGTGAVFSLLPPQNATGNWIKIIQRIPIRIKLNPKELKKHPLHAGNSMEVTVNLREQDGKAMTKLKIAPKTIYLYKKALKEAEKIAENIIRQNS